MKVHVMRGMTKLPVATRVQILSMLVEGSSLRSISRVGGVSINTVTKLLIEAGCACSRFQRAAMVNLPCKSLQLDEIWGFIGKKVRHLREDDDPTFGDVLTYCAIDAETKLVPSYKVASKRNMPNTIEFIADLKSRMNNRIQISSDAMPQYEEAIDFVYGMDVDYAQIVKNLRNGRK